jgi:hypothetical protein
MGYRSKVIFGIKEKHQDKFNKLIKKACEMEDSDYFKNKVKIVEPKYTDDKWIVFEDDWLKWYCEYEEVKLINETIDDWYCEDENCGAFMICLGEDGFKHQVIGEWYEVVMEEHSLRLDLKNK